MHIWVFLTSQLTAVFSTFQLYYHGDPIPVKVEVNNETSKVVKKIKITSMSKLFILQNNQSVLFIQFCSFSLLWFMFFEPD